MTITVLDHILFSKEPVTDRSPFCFVMAYETTFIHSAYLLFILIPLIDETLCLWCEGYSLPDHTPLAESPPQPP